MGPHTFCMEPPIHAWCAQYSYEHTVHDLITHIQYSCTGTAVGTTYEDLHVPVHVLPSTGTPYCSTDRTSRTTKFSIDRALKVHVGSYMYSCTGSYEY